MPRKLKVFRTAIGFHDAYVAAPTQKAALEAWGTDTNLFARGVAELVTDPALSEAPLAHPGQVIKRLRGSEAEHFAALRAEPEVEAASGRPSETKAPRAGRKRPATPKRGAPPRPRPDRAALDQAEEALEEAERAARLVAQGFRERERALARERRAAERDAEAQIGECRASRDAEKVRYDRALARWRN